MRPVLVALFAAVLTSSVLDAQQVSETVEVRLIEVDAVVTDRKGNPVSGLTAADFELFENGRAQAITNFAEYRVACEADGVTRRGRAGIRSSRASKSPGHFFPIVGHFHCPPGETKVIVGRFNPTAGHLQLSSR